MKIMLNGRDISAVVSAVCAEKSLLSPAQQFRFQIIRPIRDSYFPVVNPACGDTVSAVHQAYVFDGKIERVEYNAAAALATVVCFDDGLKLCNNQLYGMFSGTGSGVALQVCQKVGLGCGDIWQGPSRCLVPPGCGLSGFDIINLAYGVPISAFMDNGKMVIEEPGTRELSLKQDMLIDVKSGQSLEKVINRVSIMGYGGRREGFLEDGKSIAANGVRSRVKGLAGAKSGAGFQAQAAIVKMRPFAELIIPGDGAITCGSTVFANGTDIGVAGKYTITYVRHSFEDGVFLTYITLEGLVK